MAAKTAWAVLAASFALLLGVVLAAEVVAKPERKWYQSLVQLVVSLLWIGCGLGMLAIGERQSLGLWAAAMIGSGANAVAKSAGGRQLPSETEN